MIPLLLVLGLALPVARDLNDLSVAPVTASIQPAALAQTTLLLPINTGTTPGLFESQWQTQLSVANMSDTSVEVRDLAKPFDCPVDACFGYTVARRSTLVIEKGVLCDKGGCLGHVDASKASDVSLTLRTRDTTRQNASWGVSVPVVRDTQFYQSPFSLMDLPVDPQFRATLRVYDVDPTTLPQVLVRVYATDPTPLRDAPDTLVFEFTPTFSRGSAGFAAAVSETYLWGVPNLPTTGRLRVEVIPLDGRKEYWGFVSITNNTTQKVTIVTP